jgi:hypothetical protein
MELSRGEYVSTIMMLTKDIFGNWIEHHMCGDYHPLNKRTCSDKYAMPLLEETFDAVGQAKVFSSLDLRSGYHQLPLREGDKVKTFFYEIDPHVKDCLYQWKFLPFGLKNALAEFQRIMDQMLAGFAKCKIDDIIVFSLTSRDHMHYLRKVFGRFLKHNLKPHLGKCWFFHTQVKYLGHMIYPNGLKVQKAKVEAISQVPQATNVSRLQAFMGLCNYY